MNKFILRSIRALILSFLLIFSAACTSGEKHTKSAAKEDKTVELTISAAANTRCIKRNRKQYKEKEPNIKLSFNFGASGALQQQIEQGAPADLFFSAAEDKFKPL